MKRLNTEARLPQDGNMSALLRRLADLQRENAALVNALAEGRIAGSVNALPAAPVTGNFTPGDFVRNSAPTELGAAGSKYVVEGWMCLAAPATFVQKRFFTGN
jgi:hypothetical protein